jgi:ATP-dependent DNA ligase
MLIAAPFDDLKDAAAVTQRMQQYPAYLYLFDLLYVASRQSVRREAEPWWFKVKCVGRQAFVVAGFTDPQRSRVGLGALLIGCYSDDGQRLIYAGKIGTGYTPDVLLDLRARLDRLEQGVSPFDAGDLPHGPQLHWVKPQFVAEIASSEWTQNGLRRQPRFEGLRTDKTPRECRRERPETDIQPGALRDDDNATGGKNGKNVADQQSLQAAAGDTMEIP